MMCSAVAFQMNRGVSLAAGAPDQREQAGRLLDLLVDGLRHHASGPARS